MTIDKNKIEKKFNLFAMALCLFLMPLIITACSKKENKSENGVNKNINSSTQDTLNSKSEESKKVIKLTKIVFEKNNDVYLYNKTNGQIKSLGDDLKSKDLLKLSPDKTKVVFRYFFEDQAVYPPHIAIYDLLKDTLEDITIDNKYTQQIMELQWLDDENILVTGHINPSASGYAVYNINNKKELISCTGTLRDVSINKKNILYSDTPHIFPQPKANLYINGNRIFEVSNEKEQIFDGALSKDGKILVFRSWIEDEKNPNKEVSAYINVAKVSDDLKEISDLKKIAINSDTAGTIKFDDENNISIVGEEFIYKIEGNNLIKQENTLPKKQELSEEELKEFKQALAKKFPEEFITEEILLEDIDVYNMEAF